ncbi:MAG: ABC transporter permease [Anaerolineae bacterium]
MRNVLTIIKHEIRTTIGKRSFWLTTFLLPAVIIIANIGSQALARSAVAQDGSNPLLGSSTTAQLPIGYVDLAGIIKTVPDDAPLFVKWPSVRLRPFKDEVSATAALEDGKISKYYIVPADYLKTGQVTLVDSQFSMFNSLDNSDFFGYLIRLNLSGDQALAVALTNPTAEVQMRSLAPQRTSNVNGKDEGAGFIVPFAALFIFFFVITMTSGFMLQSVSKEKENRTIEVLLLSVQPRELMLGKVLGLGIVALLQVAIWAGGGLLVMNRGGFENVTLPDGFIVWALLYFVLGYLLYASVLGALGALAPSAREGGQFTFIVLLPLMIPLWMSNALIQSPNDGPALFFSLFPLTSPTSMITRLAAAPVPIEQLLLGLVLLAATTYGVVLLAARFFKADTLLSMANLNVRRIFQALRRSA